jgi:hypothetical protein
MEMIDIKVLDSAGLENFINSPEFQKLQAIPISRHRALSQIKNPRAASDDVLLILAYSGAVIIGYLGTIPDYLFIDGERHKCAVLSCIWVKPALRKSDVSMKLLAKSHELYPLIFGSDYVPATIKMYNRSEFFCQELKLDGARIYMRMDLHSILPPKKKFYKTIKPLLYATDILANSLLDIRFVISNHRKIEGVEYVNDVDAETASFITTLQENQLFKRNKLELNWILHNPWIVEDASQDDRRYYFTSVEKVFRFICIKLRDESNEIVGFMILSRRNRVLKVPYCYLQPAAVEKAARVLTNHLYEWKINTFITHHPQLSEYFLTHNIGQLFKKKSSRLYLFSKELHQLMKNVRFELQDGDADAAFV